jgi:hypothetical protein
LLIGVIAGLVVAIMLIGRVQVVISNSSRNEVDRGTGCALIPALLILLVLGLLLASVVTPSQPLAGMLIGG